MRPEFMEPSVFLGAEGLRDVLLVVCVDVPVDGIERWTEHERMLAYDWAAREHLAASDNPIRRRPMPSFITAAAEARERERAAAYDALTALAGRLDRVSAVCARLARFAAVQARDGLPDPDTGQTHCTTCHGVGGNPYGPSCGHTAGCPEC